MTQKMQEQLVEIKKENRRSAKAFYKISAIIFLSSSAFSAAADKAPLDNVASAIQTSIETSNEVSGLNIDVTNNDGIIKLSGIAGTNRQAAKLVEIAESANGVKDVDTSRLINRYAQHIPANILLSAKVVGTFVREKLFSADSVGMPISVKAFKSTVFLSGTVSNQAIVEAAVKMAKAVPGVTQAKSELIVKEYKTSKKQ